MQVPEQSRAPVPGRGMPAPEALVSPAMGLRASGPPVSRARVVRKPVPGLPVSRMLVARMLVARMLVARMPASALPAASRLPASGARWSAAGRRARLLSPQRLAEGASRAAQAVGAEEAGEGAVALCPRQRDSLPAR
jgi:hypothetical protein